MKKKSHSSIARPDSSEQVTLSYTISDDNSATIRVKNGKIINKIQAIVFSSEFIAELNKVKTSCSE